MLSPGAYAFDVLSLALLGLSVGFSAFRIRRHLLPTWDGAPARLVEAVLAVALLIWLSQLLGLFGLLYAWTLIAEALLLAAAVALWPIGAPGPRGTADDHTLKAPSVSRWMTIAAIAVVALVFAHWGLTTADALSRGIFNFDSLWYHMPFAAEIAQSHSLTELHRTDTVFTNWFYPQNSELLHAVGILLTEHDTQSLFVNFGWLAIAFLAAWCIGRPYGHGPLSVVAAAIVLASTTLLEREPGSAKNDIMAAALLLAAVATLISAWAARRRQEPLGIAAAGGGNGSASLSLEPGWALAATGLAAGLAAGTRVTLLPMVVALSVAAIALAPAGRKQAALGWWTLPALAGGGYWYLRNLIAAGNPLPQIERLGPIPLPHPEQLQSGRPDFSVAHYATDTTVWQEYFGPGLEHAFGPLWPLAIGLAIAGALLAVASGRDRLLRWLGGVALFGALAYLFTPLGAAGVEGAPVAFRFNLRFLVPALLAGLVLLPLARGLDNRGRQWALLGVLLAILVLSNDTESVLGDPDAGFGLLVALLAVILPAALLLARRWGESDRAVASGFALLALLVVAVGYPLQRDYLDQRFGPDSGIPGYELDSAYAWAQGVSGARIGLAGTTAGLQSYGFYGPDASNHVLYLGEEAPRGAFNPIPTCSAFRAAVNGRDLDFLVTSPFLNFVEPSRPLFSPEAAWLAGEPAVQPTLRNGEVSVWRVDGRLDPDGCGAENAPLREVPRPPPD